ncbi:phage terminase large subunit family protein [Herbaspirillum frisingense]|uniref:phage terminase large subunit family protein n=1 Tax=Herbaspirillum frisingense TaxID=92645 RepID=UPI0035B4FFEE
MGDLLTRLVATLVPPEKLTTTEWARRHRGLSAKASAKPGRYNPDITPWVHGIHEALDDPTVFKVVAQKSSQIAWTDGVLNNYLGKRIDIDPCPIIVMFSKDKAAKEYNDEKFVPMVEATPRLMDKIPVSKKRDKENRVDFKQFPGGFLKFVGSNSPASVKSTPAPVVAVEEPDDCNDNVKEQGDTISSLEERTKTFARRKIIFGGTPTIAGVSKIEQAYLLSDQRKFFIPCHECGEAHVLEWENVVWLDNPEIHHEVFGHAVPSSARYRCPHCGALWTDAEKNRNVRKGTWRATATFHGVAGFWLNEVYSPFPGSTMPLLVEKFLAAKHALAQGDDTKMRVFRNNTEGKSYEYASELPDLDALKDRAEDYEELVVPWGGLVVTAGCDVQHDRIAVVIRVWGRGEESWLLYWGEIHGKTLIPNEGAWVDLDQLLSKPIPHEGGSQLSIRAVSIDSSDGQTSDAVYAFVRDRLNRGYLAVKGASSDDGREIFAPPRPSIDTNRQNKAAKFGVKPFMVGTERAKDLLLGQDSGAGRIRLQGKGPGRMHWYKAVRPDYYEQITSEVKAPHRTLRNKKVWQKKSGVRNEALDCEVYALHAARSLKIHLYKESHWAMLEDAVRQKDIFEASAAVPTAQAAAAPAPANPQATKKPRSFNLPRPGGGFKASSW